MSSTCMDSTQATRSGKGPSNVRTRSGGWNMGRKRRRKVAAPHPHIPGDYVSSEAGGRKLISSPPIIHVMKYMVPSVLVVVTLKYQAKTESLFLENPAPVWCFLAATCVYWLIVGAVKQMTTIGGKYSQIFSHAALASGLLSAISLVSIFLPYPVSLLPVAISISLPLVLVVLPYAYGLFHRGIESVVNKIHAMTVWARGCNLTEEASSPV